MKEEKDKEKAAVLVRTANATDATATATVTDDDGGESTTARSGRRRRRRDGTAIVAPGLVQRLKLFFDSYGMPSRLTNFKKDVVRDTRTRRSRPRARACARAGARPHVEKADVAAAAPPAAVDLWSGDMIVARVDQSDAALDKPSARSPPCSSRRAPRGTSAAPRPRSRSRGTRTSRRRRARRPRTWRRWSRGGLKSAALRLSNVAARRKGRLTLMRRGRTRARKPCARRQRRCASRAKSTLHSLESCTPCATRDAPSCDRRRTLIVDQRARRPAPRLGHDRREEFAPEEREGVGLSFIPVDRGQGAASVAARRRRRHGKPAGRRRVPCTPDANVEPPAFAASVSSSAARQK